MKRFVFAVVSLLVFLLWQGRAYAHPHTWIEFDIRVTFDDQGRVTGLHQTWLFDAYYTMFVVEGAEKLTGAEQQDALNALLAENLKNLAEYRYFTHIYSGETPLETKIAENAATRMAGDRLEMSFFLPLAEPVEARELAVSYQIYDPTYYVEMLHYTGKDSITLDGAAGCQAKLIEANPDPSETLYASSLAQSETGYDGLGKLFAETATIKCG